MYNLFLLVFIAAYNIIMLCTQSTHCIKKIYIKITLYHNLTMTYHELGHKGY